MPHPPQCSLHVIPLKRKKKNLTNKRSLQSPSVARFNILCVRRFIGELRSIWVARCSVDFVARCTFLYMSTVNKRLQTVHCVHVSFRCQFALTL